MRRTLLSVLVAVASFAVTSVVLVGGFQLIAGGSEAPAQGSSSRASDEATSTAPTSTPTTDVQEPAPTGPTTDGPGPFFGTGIGVGPGLAPPAVDALPTQEPKPTEGLLSEDFRKLGVDDPTTVVDESLRSACDVVGGTIAGPALCTDR